jgi:hypothetical protein
LLTTLHTIAFKSQLLRLGLVESAPVSWCIKGGDEEAIRLKAGVMIEELMSRDHEIPCAAPPPPRTNQGNATRVYLIAVIALVFSLVVAVTAISIGIARAGSLPPPFNQTSLSG